MPVTSVQNARHAADSRTRQLRRSLPFGAVACAAVLTLTTSALARSIPDIRQLYRVATSKVRHADHGQLAKAVLYEADGSTAGGHAVSTAAGISRWRFVFDNPTKGSRYLSASVTYGSHGFGRVVAHTTPYLEDIKISQPPKLSLAAAVARLRAVGHHESFSSVTLRNPLQAPFAGPRFIFGLSARQGETTFVSVSATTGKLVR